jgi:hypothetical protein
MPEFELGPLPLALIVSILGSTFLVWHRHGGPRWRFAAGGFLFVLGRLMIAAICVFLLFAVSEMMFRLPGADRQLLAAGFGLALLAVGGWSLLVTVRAVRRDAFGSAREADARVGYTDRHS